MKNYNINILSNQGFPFCPKCGGVLYWDGDCTKYERGLVSKDDPHEGETVNQLHCVDCNRDFELIDTDNGYEFVDTSRY